MTKINWKKEFEEVSNKYSELSRNHWSKGDKWACAICCIIFTVLFTFFIIGLFGGFDNPVKELGLNEEELVREYTLYFYPEFENCSIEYDDCISVDGSISCKKGVEIYCDELDNRDDFKVKREKDPTEILHFDDIELRDILLHKIRRCQ